MAIDGGVVGYNAGVQRRPRASCRMKSLADGLPPEVAAQVHLSVRRVYVRLSSAYPLRGLFIQCQRKLLAQPLWCG